jgi:hypothetical protein
MNTQYTKLACILLRVQSIMLILEATPSILRAWNLYNEFNKNTNVYSPTFFLSSVFQILLGVVIYFLSMPISKYISKMPEDS